MNEETGYDADEIIYLGGIAPNPALFNDYIDRNPVHRSVQVSGDMSENEVKATSIVAFT